MMELKINVIKIIKYIFRLSSLYSTELKYTIINAFNLNTLYKKNLLILAYKNKDYIQTCKHKNNTWYKKNINAVKTNCNKLYGLKDC